MIHKDNREHLASAIAKSRMRLVPFVALMFAIAIIDRSNVGFVKNVLQADVGISNAAFAFGASIFFIGYACFEIPSNLILHRVGARLWLSRIMVVWGLVSAAMMFVQNEMSFYALRFMLGVAEAGFFPGVILYLTYWFPAQQRGRALSIYYFGLPLALLFGSPISGMLLDMGHVFGLKNWQWMFLVEGFAAVVIGVIAFFYLVDRPHKAKWLTEAEKEVLESKLAHENQQKLLSGPKTLLSAFTDMRVLRLALIYSIIQLNVYGIIFYLPTHIASLLDSNVGTAVGLLTAIPWLCAVIVMYFAIRYADRTNCHQQFAIGMLIMMVLGITTLIFSTNLILALIASCFAVSGFVAVQPLFWTLPTRYLGGIPSAGGIALINALGNLGGFLAPNLKTAVEILLESQRAGLLALAIAGVIGVLLLSGHIVGKNNPSA